MHRGTCHTFYHTIKLLKYHAMLKKTIVISRKVQLAIDSSDPKSRDAYYKKLFTWQDLVYRGSNLVLTHQYVQENIRDFIYLQDDIKVRLSDAGVDEMGILNTSRLNTTYKILSSYFKGEIPTDILSNLNVTLTKTFNTDKKAYWKGEKSLRNFKKDMPIPFSGKQIKISTEENKRDFKINIFKIPFRTYLGKDRSDKRVLLRQAMLSQIKVCASSIKLIKGKIYLLLALEVPRNEYELKEHVVAKASLSVAYPITVTVQKSLYRIGSREEFTYRRTAIQAARHRVQHATAFNNGGKGRKKKLKALEHFKDKERKYVDSRLHRYSRNLIDICIKSQAGTLHLLSQRAKEELTKEDDLLLHNWGYYGLIEKIKYKADMAGITIIVD